MSLLYCKINPQCFILLRASWWRRDLRNCTDHYQQMRHTLYNSIHINSLSGVHRECQHHHWGWGCKRYGNLCVFVFINLLTVLTYTVRLQQLVQLDRQHSFVCPNPKTSTASTLFCFMPHLRCAASYLWQPPILPVSSSHKSSPPCSFPVPPSPASSSFYQFLPSHVWAWCRNWLTLSFFCTLPQSITFWFYIFFCLFPMFVKKIPIPSILPLHCTYICMVYITLTFVASPTLIHTHTHQFIQSPTARRLGSLVSGILNSKSRSSQMSDSRQTPTSSVQSKSLYREGGGGGVGGFPLF